MNLKTQIMTKFQQGELNGIEDLILAYEEENPKDLELISMKVTYFVYMGNNEEALNWACIGVRRNPFNTEANYNLAYVYDLVGDPYEAYRWYSKALFLATNENNEDVLNLNITENLNKIMKQLKAMANTTKDKKEEDHILKQIERLKEEGKNGFGLLTNTFKDYETNIGKAYIDYDGHEAYVGFYDRMANHFQTADNMIQEKGEIRPIVVKCDRIQVDDRCERILPIVSEEKNILVIQEDQKEYTLPIKKPKHFSYYRVKPNTKLFSKLPIQIGKPIPLMYDEKKKKIVLSLFVDGLSQILLEEEGFEKIMPNTYQFFKKGTICNNAYSASEWTYPSLASYVTGLDTTHHMLIHNKLNATLPLDTTTLTEYFSKAGYQTAKIDGDWRSTPNYGYLRGMDRILFQHQWTGMRTQEVVCDALDHMELMKDTNHYMWIGIGDLHDIADEVVLPASVESKLSIAERVIENGETSAKQPFSMNKRKAYIEQAKMIDQYLGLIYTYIEKNYTEEEYIVSLFADHGQGYFVKPNEFFLSPERTKVAFMFRGGHVKEAFCNELISTVDYSTILCKLCGVEMNHENIDGRLPKQFGGVNEREYVIAESIHPKDCYYASVYWKDYICNFAAVEPVREDGRFSLNQGYSIELLDYSHNSLHDDDLLQKNLKIILDHIGGNLIYD